MRIQHFFFPAALLSLTGAPLLAQGADACASAQPISGTGVFPFDNSTATTDGTPSPLCLAFGNDDIANDVWFAWTAPSSGYFRLNTCGQTGVDTKVGIYAGSCAGTVLACNDDACGLQTELSFAATSSSTYLVRLGTFPGAAGGTGSFTIVEQVPVQNPDNGHHYLAVLQQGITWTDAQATAQSIQFQGVAGHLATLTSQTENDFVFGLGNMHWHWIGGYQDTSDPSYSEPAGGWKWVTGEPWSYTNWWTGEPNDTGAFGAENFLELLEGSGFGPSWNDVHPLEHARGFVIEWDTGTAAAYCFGDGSGTACPCGNTGGSGQGCANSSGQGAEVASSGSASVAADDLGFSASNLLPSQPALLFSGDNAVNGGNGLVFGDGLRCVGGGVRRLGVRVPNAGGDASWGPGLVALGGFSAGQTKRFQVWYRNPTNSPCGFNYNLSHGLEIVFVP